MDISALQLDGYLCSLAWENYKLSMQSYVFGVWISGQCGISNETLMKNEIKLEHLVNYEHEK